MSYYILGDPHVSRREPYATALRLAFEEVLAVIAGDNSPIIITGDFFHSGCPLPSEIQVGQNFLQALGAGGREIYVVAGNHDYGFRNGKLECALDTVRSFCRVIDVPEIILGNVMCLPFFYRDHEGRGMYDVYSSDWLKANVPQKAQLVVGHFFDESLGSLFGMRDKLAHVDLSAIRPEVIRVLGHDHTPGGDYIGSMTPTEFEKKDVRRRFLWVNTDGATPVIESIPLKRAIDFRDCGDADFKKLLNGIDVGGPTLIKLTTGDRALYEEFRNAGMLRPNVWMHSAQFVSENVTVAQKTDVEFEKAKTDLDRLMVFLAEGDPMDSDVQQRLIDLMAERG